MSNSFKALVLKFGITAAAFTGLGIFYLAANGPIPTNGDWFHQYLESELEPEYRMAAVRGGGHFYIVDGRDLWLRFQIVPTAASAQRFPEELPPGSHPSTTEPLPTAALNPESQASESQLAPLLRTRLPERCNSEQRDRLLRWFSPRVMAPKRWSWLIPLSESMTSDRALDQESFKPGKALECYYSDTIPVNSWTFPTNCGSWWLYNPTAQVAYTRYACYN